MDHIPNKDKLKFNLLISGYASKIDKNLYIPNDIISILSKMCIKECIHVFKDFRHYQWDFDSMLDGVLVNRAEVEFFKHLCKI